MQARKKTETLFISRRTNSRFVYTEPFQVTVDGQIVRAVAINLSASGISAQLRGLGLLKERTRLNVFLHNFKPVPGVVRWTRAREVGIQFTEDLANHPQIRALVARIENGEPPLGDPPS
jgi:hypothetical protein